MSLNVAFLILLLLIVIYIIFIEIFTVVFMLTGMSHTRARFQVISLLTSCGFTTAESEIVVSSRTRRKIAITIMIFGNLFNVSVVSLLVNTIMSFSKRHSFSVLQATSYLIVFVVFIAIIKRVPWVRVTFDKVVKRIATKVMFNKNSNPLLILDNFHGFVIVEVKVIEVPKKFNNKTLLESRISKDYGIRILAIKRDDRTIGDISMDEMIIKNDRMIVYGPLANIVEVFGQQPSYYSSR
ncbi:MAG: conserved rane protein of unknown function [Clostridia bacterium]|jgi:hypothetical protein|nr:conserved rane protein of unknown function [Clostridia bacterium]